MSRAAKTADMVKILKAVRDEYGYSYQNIFDKVEAAGEYVSMSSIRRVFADGSENQNFRYEDVIRPLARALLGVDEVTKTPDPKNKEQREEYYLQIEGLKTAVELKDIKIAELEEKLKKSEWELNYIKEREGKGSKMKTLLFAIISVVFLMISVIDVTNGNMGFIQYETMGIVEILLFVVFACVFAYIVYEASKMLRKK